MKRIMCVFIVCSMYILVNVEGAICTPNTETSLPMQKDWSVIAQEAKNVVVKIEIERLDSISIGSGFFVNNGLIITNYHVVKNAPMKSLTVVGDKDEDVGIVTITPYQDDQAAERYYGVVFPSLCFPQYDIAFVIVPKDKGKTLPFNELPKVGKPVLVIGSPEGFEFSLTSGIISAFRQDNDGMIYIQTDAAINGGNSGGPLIDSDGKIVGVATRKIASAGIDNMAFAISIKTVMDILYANDLSHLMKIVKETDIKKLSSKASNSDISKTVKAEDKNTTETQVESKQESKPTDFRVFYIICAIFTIGYLVKRILKIKK